MFLLGKNRNRLSIIAAILDVASEGSSKTRIMYQANLNYTPWGIRLAPITFSLLALTAVFATVGLIREYQTKTNLGSVPAYDS